MVDQDKYEFNEDYEETYSEGDDQDYDQQHDDDDDEIGIDDSQHEEFTTIRLKKLVSSLIAEFKPCN